MRLSPVKRLVLETMWVLDKPAKAIKIAEEVGLAFPSVMMHILGLAKMGYVKTPESGHYIITEEGKRSLGFPEIDPETAKQIMLYQPVERSFHFYADVGKPLNVFAANLQDFCDKIQKVGIESIEFHTGRGDFQAWFAGLGDVELARKTMLIEERKISGEELQKRLCEVVRSRCESLQEIRQQAETAVDEVV